MQVIIIGTLKLLIVFVIETLTFPSSFNGKDFVTIKVGTNLCICSLTNIEIWVEEKT